ncbi:hypothetical protein V7794_22970 [Rhizobium laguerreae]
MTDAPKKIDHGGSAFPILPPVDGTGREAVGYPYIDPGMTLRDWFAGQALPVCMQQLAAVSQNDFVELGRGYGITGQISLPDLASRLAYRQADAMIAKRNDGAS